MIVPSDFPKTLPEFEARFGTEEQCREFFTKLRWPDGFVCPVCGSREGYHLNSRDLYECPCGRQTSLTAGTLFQGTRKPLRLWFKAMFLLAVSKAGLSAMALKRLMGFGSDQTAWAWLHKLRKAMVRPGRPKMDGKVELDETFVGGVVEGACGRGSPNPIVMAAVERLDEPGRGTRRWALGRVRLQVVEAATQASATAFAAENIEARSTVVTDGLAIYDNLRKAGFDHRPRVIGENQKRATKLLPGVHRVFSLLKRWLLGAHQGAVSPWHLQSYLDEFVFRFNRRRSSHPGKLVYRLAELAITTRPQTYRATVDHLGARVAA